MDSHHATVVGRNANEREFVIMGHIKNSGAKSNASEKAFRNSEKTLQHKFYKEITGLMQMLKKYT